MLVSQSNSGQQRHNLAQGRGDANPLDKREYVQVEPRQRLELIKKTFSKQMSVRSAAKSLGIKYTTARHIVNVYKRTGHVESLTAMKRKLRHPVLMR